MPQKKKATEETELSLLDQAKLAGLKITATAAKVGTQALNYAKAHPDEVLLAITAVCLWDMDQALESIDENTEISAVVDITEYYESK